MGFGISTQWPGSVAHPGPKQIRIGLGWPVFYKGQEVGVPDSSIQPLGLAS